MNYLLLIYQNEAEFEALSEAEKTSLVQECEDFHQRIVKTGHFRGCEALQFTPTATTIRTRNGKRTVTDGPFAETKEQLTGFFLVEAKNLDEAIEIASQLPAARIGSVEVRPVIR